MPTKATTATKDHPSQGVRYAKCQQKPQQQQQISLGKGKMPIQKPFNETPLS